MDLAKTVAIVIAGIFARTVAYTFVIVATIFQATVDVVLIRVDQGARGNRRLNQRLDRHLLDVCQHSNHNVTAAFNHSEDRRFLALKRATSTGSFESPSSAGMPFFTTSSGWPLCPATM